MKESTSGDVSYGYKFDKLDQVERTERHLE